MTKAEAQNNNALPHDLILEGRGKLTVTGVRRMLECGRKKLTQRFEIR